MPFVGTIRVPSDKSISHRAVLFAGLAQGVSRLEAVLPSDDVHATIEAIKALGAHVNLAPGFHGLEGKIEGIGKTGTNGQDICPTFPPSVWAGCSAPTVASRQPASRSLRRAPLDLRFTARPHGFL